ncbi:M48 family metalloprotease [Uliginosibacterium gangwonense]|uniref:M48 family metalloprotease n=1 Tax=Uliginosibacterium gangwonense TaxID=392736 RepID=UPI0003A8913F|nr:M48 family metalloprotease [Uliginosibacterium gangwonense]
MKFKYLSPILCVLLITACASNGGQSTSSSSASNTASVLGAAGTAANKAGVTAKGNDVGLAAMTAGDAINAANISDKDVQTASAKAAKYDDKKNNATTTGKYGRRLVKLTSKMTTVEGLKLNFKVIPTSTPNAYAFADGSIRVTTALMDMLTDDELRFVLGHEIGHVKLGHTAAKMKTALLTSAARKGVAATSGVAGDLAASELGGFTEALINAQYSQGAEKEADDFGLAFTKKYHFKPAASVSALEKIAKLGDNSSALSSHPASGERAKRLSQQLASGQ